MDSNGHECVETSEAKRLMKSIDEMLEATTRFVDGVTEELHKVNEETEARPYDADATPVLASAPLRMLMIAGVLVTTLESPNQRAATRSGRCSSTQRRTIATRSIASPMSTGSWARK